MFACGYTLCDGIYLSTCMNKNVFWSSISGRKQSQKQIDDILLLFTSTYEQLEGESLRHLMVSIYMYHAIHYPGRN